MTIFIGEDELIVGNYATTLHHMTTIPEMATKWSANGMNDGYRSLFTDEVREAWGDKQILGR